VKGTPIALRNHMAQGSTTLAVLNKITRRDGEVMAITLDHDRPLVYQGVVYEPKFGAMPSTIETTGAINVDNVDIKGALLALGVNEADISAGLWDGAQFIAYRVNWRNLSMGAEILKSGTFGQISIGRGTFTNEVRGITQKLQQVQGEVVSPSCKDDLFGPKCGLAPLEGFSKFENVFLLNEFPATRRTFAANIAQADGWFDGGKVVWTDGANVGLSMEIKTQVGQQIELQEPMPYEISHDDHCTIYAGCLKRFEDDCKLKFSNHVRFFGFPTVPGQDQMLRGPD
jgi:uncharacterized phage protein (TIGR02218 family)